MTLHDYLTTLDKRYQSGISKEHSYRGDLESLLRSLAPTVEITNEPANVTDCGNPDYVIMQGEIPVGYIEAKDIGKDLNAKQYQEQFERYRKALDNLIITDYLWFRFYQNGELEYEIRIGEIQDGKIVALPDNFIAFDNRIKDFCTFVGQTIKSAQKLAELMAGKARLLQNTLENAVTSDEQNEDNSSLQDQLRAFKNMLIHDISPREFADIYAQTLAYGMFAARLHDPTLETFSRQEAAELIPKSNPFLRKLFQYIAGYDIDARIRRTVDNLADVFRATDVKTLLQNFGKATQQNDPVIHFYETFLAAYDPKLRKARGVWYTPEPVVNFIVRAVDDILKTEFGIKNGLADTEKTTVDVQTQVPDKRTASGYKTAQEEIHRVQILDPATGTGTFLAEIIKHIYHSRFKSMQGLWSRYVEEDLIPRLNGFELLMASYAMAHLKLDMLLTETGYQPKKAQRFRVFLTNSLEEYHPDTGSLFASWLSNEAQEANRIKRDTPVMVVLGNPPYAVSSSNKGEWIQNLIKDYKKDLNEKKINLDDDYIKFIRYGQHFIEKNGEGILAFISNNSFLDGVTHRQMRKHLLETFDKIYILDLHGNAKKKETAPDGGKDENVFDIMQGVSINIFVKNGDKYNNKFADVFHVDSYGLRNEKYNILWKAKHVNSLDWVNLNCKPPFYFFCQKDYGGESLYKNGFDVISLFKIYISGFQTKRDKITIQHTEKEIQNIREIFILNDIDTIRKLLNLPADGRDWTIADARNDLENNAKLEKISYRPFDDRFTFYSKKAKRFIAYPRNELLQNFRRENLGLVLKRSRLLGDAINWKHIGIVNKKCDINFLADQSFIFPLYLYSDGDNKQQSLTGEPAKEPNLNPEIVREIVARLGLEFSGVQALPGHQAFPALPDSPGRAGKQGIQAEPGYQNTQFTPLDLLDYIYAVLHSPSYRETYKEFLKIDFPRVPYPEDPETFWQLVALGGELRQLHLLESLKLEKYITGYPQDGDNVVTRAIGKKDWELTDKNNGRVWINDQQYFDQVPLIAWEFYIGGYQPAQKWLKDRKGRELSFDDILHYQKIIVALSETARLMGEIDAVLGEA